MDAFDPDQAEEALGSTAIEDMEVPQVPDDPAAEIDFSGSKEQIEAELLEAYESYQRLSERVIDHDPGWGEPEPVLEPWELPPEPTVEAAAQPRIEEAIAELPEPEETPDQARKAFEEAVREADTERSMVWTFLEPRLRPGDRLQMPDGVVGSVTGVENYVVHGRACYQTVTYEVDET